MESLRQDLRYGLRSLVARPGFSALVILTLAMGIGVNAVAFSAINGLLRKPMRFDGASDLGRVRMLGTSSAYAQTSLPDFLDIARENLTFEALFAEARIPLSMRPAAHDGSSAAPAEEVWGLLVSVNYFEALRARPLIGRAFSVEDARSGEPAAIVSERFWRERLGGGPSTAGRTVTLNGQSFSIIGVMSDGFQGPGGLYEPQVWLPLEQLAMLNLRPELRDRKTNWLTVLGRVKPGTTPQQAQADLQGIVSRLNSVYPDADAGRRVAFVPFSEGVAELDTIAKVSWIGLAVVGTVLLIACFNVAALLLARAAERQREIGVRAALGASRRRILQQLFTEGLILATLSGIVAMILASWSADLLAAFSLPSPIPQRLHIPVDERLTAFIVGLVALAGMLPAVAPAIQASRLDLVGALRRDSALGGRPSRTRNAFVIAQVAGSTLFMAAALLFARSFINSARIAPGFDTDNTLVLELNTGAYGYDATRARTFFTELIERIAAMPNVRSVALADRAPYSVGFPKTLDIARSGQDCSVAKCASALEYGISPAHFSTLGLPFRAGRDLLEPEYRTVADVAIIGEALATDLFGNFAANAVGQSIRVGKEGRRLQVIGVAADARLQSFSDDPRWYVYRPLRNDEFKERVAVIVSAANDPRSLLGAVRQQVHALDPLLPAASIKTTRERMELPLWPARTAAGFFIVCGTLALVLATIGLFGVTYYTVIQRTREFGVRAALGATRRRVVGLVIREGLMLSVPGVVLGIGGALVAMQLLSRALFGISPLEPATYALTATVQILVAVAACALPAYRATKVDPLTALRAE